MMGGNCKHAYRKPGRKEVFCEIQSKMGKPFDFCAHQYMCSRTKQYELNENAADCPAKDFWKKQACEACEEGKSALAEAQRVFAAELQPKIMPLQ